MRKKQLLTKTLFLIENRWRKNIPPQHEIAGISQYFTQVGCFIIDQFRLIFRKEEQ